MKTIEYRTVDKSGWGEGPWQSEPDKKQWLDEETGLPCLMVRGPSGALCGYVGVPQSHPYYGKDYDDGKIDVNVHWGLTFASKCSPGPEDHSICHAVEAGEDDDVWWLGFDCAHAYDYCPKFGGRYPRGEDAYRDQAFVENECRSLAKQLKEQAADEIANGVELSADNCARGDATKADG